MSLDHILLGMLREPAAGYDLKKEFEGTGAHFWSAHLSQIYPTLGRMEERGWLDSRTEPSDRGPDRRVYRRTEAGERELARWLRAGPELDPPRLAYLGQLFHMGELEDLDATEAFLRELRGAFEARRSALESVEWAWSESCPDFPDGLSDEDFHAHATLRAGLRVLGARVAWCDETLERLDRRRRTHDHGDER